MAAGDLLFLQPPLASPGSVDLVFGQTELLEQTRSATLAITLPGLTAHVQLRAARRATIVAQLPGLTMSAAAQWDSRVARPTVHQASAAHQTAAPAPSGVQAPHQDAAHLPAGPQTRWQAAAPQPAGVASLIAGRFERTRAGARAAHQDAMRLDAAHVAHQSGDMAHDRRQALASRHAAASTLRSAAASGWAEMLRDRRLSRHAPWQPAQPIARRVSGAVRTGADLRTGRGNRWQAAMRPPPGRWVAPPVVPPSGERCYTPSPHLLFTLPADGSGNLLFICERAPGTQPVVIPIREVYFVFNTVSVARADTGQPLDVTAFSASLDADSWCWTWSASLPGAQLPLVRAPAAGEMVELVATLNGIPLHLAVERIARDRRFASSQLRISGRGRAAWLDAPYSPVRNFYNTQIRTAQQLLADALTVNNVPLGWAIDWQIEDWTVPAGAWSHGGTYKDAATRIAEAGGGYVQTHDTAQTLIVKPRYPLAPWAWGSATPDLELPEAVCETEGFEWVEKPAYNAVWIVGGDGGRRDRIKRAGTDAATVAPSIVDALATDPIMTRQRGLPVLADTGRQAHISVRLPVLAETGIVRPGTLVRYTESGNTHIGLTRAVSVEQGWPLLWQTVRIETHVPESV